MKRLALITLILGAALIVVPLAQAVIPADDGSVSGGGLATVPAGVQLTGKDLAAYYDTGAVVTSTPAVDGSANGITLHTDVLGGNGGSSSTPISGGDSFDWNTLLAVTLTGMLLLAIAAMAITRRRHRLSF